MFAVIPHTSSERSKTLGQNPANDLVSCDPRSRETLSHTSEVFVYSPVWRYWIHRGYENLAVREISLTWSLGMWHFQNPFVYGIILPCRNFGNFTCQKDSQPFWALTVFRM